VRAPPWARAVGVAQAAMEQAIAYANDRVQFGQKLIEFPRVADSAAISRPAPLTLNCASWASVEPIRRTNFMHRESLYRV
jgi:alkylation response protein AidB-like acyl-CoA dehydrogenase